MHLRPYTRIIINQTPTIDYPFRSNELTFYFVNSFICNENWTDLTNTGKIVLPRHLYYIDDYGNRVALRDNNTNFGGFTGNTPLFLKNDKVYIDSGYKYYNADNTEILNYNRIFTGYISEVGAETPIELTIEDSMYLLKQKPVATKTYTNADSLESILKDITSGLDITISNIAITNIGDFAVGGETAAQVLARIKKDYNLHFYFRNTELRGGALVYSPNDTVTHKFWFNRNVINSNLTFQRTDDLVLSAVAHNTITESSGTTKDGQAKTKKKRIEVLVTIKKGNITTHVVTKESPAPENLEGERRTFFFPQAQNVSQLTDLATEKLRQYYYTGVKGSITTFGLPYVRVGDNIQLVDNNKPDKNGTYKVKSVQRSGGVNGNRQVIELDYKLNL